MLENPHFIPSCDNQTSMPVFNVMRIHQVHEQAFDLVSTRVSQAQKQYTIMSALNKFACTGKIQVLRDQKTLLILANIPKRLVVHTDQSFINYSMDIAGYIRQGAFGGQRYISSSLIFMKKRRNLLYREIFFSGCCGEPDGRPQMFLCQRWKIRQDISDCSPLGQ
nr:hypothetical protein [Desulfonatronospira thiodismutans]